MLRRPRPSRPALGNCPSSVGRAQYRSPARLPSGCIPLQLCRRANAFQAAASQGRSGHLCPPQEACKPNQKNRPADFQQGGFVIFHGPSRYLRGHPYSAAAGLVPYAIPLQPASETWNRSPRKAGAPRPRRRKTGRSRSRRCVRSHCPHRPAPSSAIPGRSRLSCSPTLHAAELTDSQTHPFPAPAPAICAEACPAGHPPAP